MDYAGPITWTACNFGAGRPCFVCPGVVNGYVCRRRVAKLYLSGGYLLCRHCHDLIYEARQVGRKHSALRKCQKIRQSLGGSVNMMEPFPPRPKGMHLKTYGTPGKDANVQQFESAYLEEEGQRCQEGQGSHEPRCIHGYPDGAGCYLCDPSHPYRPGRAERGKSEGVTQHEDTP